MANIVLKDLYFCLVCVPNYNLDPRFFSVVLNNAMKFIPAGNIYLCLCQFLKLHVCACI